MDIAIFTHFGPPKNYIDICLDSLRRSNSSCKIYFFYSNYLVKLFYKKYDIKFIKIDKKICKNYKEINFYGILMLQKLLREFNNNDQILMLDVDLLFQSNPFEMFNEYANNDLYYSYCIMSKPESLRPKSIWSKVKWKVNSGVWGIKVNSATKELIDFWVNTLRGEENDEWLNFELRLDHLVNGKTNIWWSDQDFLNFIDKYHLSLFKKLKTVDIGFKYNYFTSTWGYFKKELTMGNKIGDKSIAVIHFKSNFKNLYNLNNPWIFNMKNILSGKDLTTKKSREVINKKFLNRGDKRFEIT